MNNFTGKLTDNLRDMSTNANNMGTLADQRQSMKHLLNDANESVHQKFFFNLKAHRVPIHTSKEKIFFNVDEIPDEKVAIFHSFLTKIVESIGPKKVCNAREISLKKKYENTIISKGKSIILKPDSLASQRSVVTFDDKKKVVNDEENDDEEDEDGERVKLSRTGSNISHPTQLRIRKKIKDAQKKILEHRRVYTEKDYAQDLMDRENDDDDGLDIAEEDLAEDDDIEGSTEIDKDEATEEEEEEEGEANDDGDDETVDYTGAGGNTSGNDNDEDDDGKYDDTETVFTEDMNFDHTDELPIENEVKISFIGSFKDRFLLYKSSFKSTDFGDLNDLGF